MEDHGQETPPRGEEADKIEHRLFSFISINWRGKPLRSYRTIVQLIASTRTDTGLTVRAELDENKYPKGVKISDAQLAAVRITPHAFPRRLELHHLARPKTITQNTNCSNYLVTGP